MKQKAIALSTALLVLGCQVPGTRAPVRGKASPGPAALASAAPVLPAGTLPSPATTGTGLISQDGGGVISRDGAGVISRDGAGVISRDGAGVISRDGAGITGIASLPAGVISRDGAGVISRDGAGVISRDGAGVISRDGAGVISRDGAGYRVAALGEAQPIRKQLVYLMNAEGHLVTGEDGNPLTATTDEAGRFAFHGFVTRRNLILAIKLYDDKGLATAVLPRGDASSRAVDVDLASTLTETYIQRKHLASSADPAATLDRLPAELEAATRLAIATAAAKLPQAPADLAGASVDGLIDGLRQANAGVVSRLKQVDDTLGAGLHDGGAGLPADSLETDAQAIATGPDGQLAFASPSGLRVFRKDDKGKLQVLAGNGFGAPLDLPAAQAAPGDGGPATAAPLAPTAIAYDWDGKLLIADNFTRRIRQVDAQGVITTRAADAGWTELRDLVVEPDGGLLVATNSGIWRVPPGGQPALICGDVRPFDPATWQAVPVPASGTTPAEGRFWNLMSIARDPLSGAIAAYDSGGSIYRLDATRFERVAGTGKLGYAGDGGPAASAQIGFQGGVCYASDGTLLIADSQNARLRQVSNGQIATVAGTGQQGLEGDGGPALQAKLALPFAPRRAPDGAIYFSDDGYIRRFAGGQIQAVVGGRRGLDTPRPATEVQLLQPQNLAYDAAANAILVPDAHHVWRWTLDDNRLISAFGGPPTAAAFAEGEPALTTTLSALAVAVVGDGSWAALCNPRSGFPAGRIVSVKDGHLATLAGGATAPSSADLDAPAIGAPFLASNNRIVAVGGKIYYSESQNGHIRRFQPGGSTEAFGGYGKQTGDGLNAKDYNFFRIAEMALGPDAQIYLGTQAYIYRLDPATGQVTYLAGAAAGLTGDGHPAKGSKLSYPAHFAWDSAGHLYFTEANAATVRRLRKDTGVIEGVAGPGTANLAGKDVDTGLGDPSGLVVDKAGDLYVADRRYGQVKIVRKAQLGP